MSTFLYSSHYSTAPPKNINKLCSSNFIKIEIVDSCDHGNQLKLRVAAKEELEINVFGLCRCDHVSSSEETRFGSQLCKRQKYNEITVCGSGWHRVKGAHLSNSNRSMDWQSQSEGN